MGQVIRCIILSLMVGICVKIYFETLLARRKWRHKWVEYTLLPVLTAGFILIAFTEIPPYFLQPLRLILLLFVTAQIYFQVKPLQNFILSVLFCGVIWIVELVTVSLIYMLPWQDYLLPGLQEEAAYCILLCLVLLLHRRLKGRAYVLENTKWLRFGYFPIISMAITAVGMISRMGMSRRTDFSYSTAASNHEPARLYFIWEILVKEALRGLSSCRKTRNQILYRQQSSFEQQKRFLHDYKISWAVSRVCWRTEKRKRPVPILQGLSEAFKKAITSRTIRSQRGAEPQVCGCAGKKITITMSVNDLSGLTMKEEEIVTLLVNLLDNAMEACES
ncbi:MAG: ATP-binding protein [Eisenbergiella massiliensis]